MIHLGTPRPPVPSTQPPQPSTSGGDDPPESPTDDDDVTDHVVHFHVNPGVTVSLQVGDCIRVVKGPMTVPMVPTVRPSPPPMPMPVQVPVGHMVQQIVDETGQLRHVILSPQHVAGSPGPPPRVDPNQPPQGMQPPTDFFPGFYAPTLIPPPPHGPPPPLMHPNPGMVRDERSTRQYHKLKRRLEHKQQQQQQSQPPSQQQQLPPPSLHCPQHSAQATASTSSPPASPNRKPPSGVTARRSKERVLVPRTGRESSSSPLSPSDQSAPLSPTPSIVLTVSDIQQCTALLTWAPADACGASVSGSEDSGVAVSEVSGGNTPLPCDPPATMYQIMVGKKGPEGVHKIVYFGPEFCHQLDNLLPGTEYSVKLSPWLAAESSGPTVYTSFVTLPAPPAPPPMPKLSTRTKTTLTIKWNSSLNNGLPISQYVVELCSVEGEERVWKQVYSGKERQCVITKLVAGQQYCVRVAATNQLGTSDFSPEAIFNTVSPPPPPPSPPVIAPSPPATPFSLSLCWPAHPAAAPNAGTYTLEMATVRIDDPSLTPEELTKRVVGGFLPVYHGPECHHVCTNLLPATTYLFRLKFNTLEGPSSMWSPLVRLATAPTIPSAPPRPQTRGRPQPQSLKIRWEAPISCGGVALQGYLLQLDDGAGYQDVWSGSGQEAIVSGLLPGHTYSLRVCAHNAAGHGPFSEPLRTGTAPAPPEAPTWSKKQAQPSSHSLLLHWDPPAVNGGAVITQYEVEFGLADSENSGRTSVYRGTETKCEISTGLSPATKYVLCVRASNVAGAGPWSSPLVMETAVAPPCSSNPPKVIVSKGGCASFSWEAMPMAVTYCLELAPLDPVLPATQPPVTAEETGETPAPIEQLPAPKFEAVYTGTETKCEVKRLLPGASYLARLQGSNSSGCGPFSEAAMFTTPVTPPGAPPHAPRLISMESDGEFVSVALSFDPPSHWGGDKEDALSYQLEIVVAGEHTGSPQLIVCQEPCIEDLTLALDTAYRVRVRALNSVGPGPLSSALRLTTPPHPPPPPQLFLAAAMPRALRLGWELTEDQEAICVEARRGEAHDFHVVYEGSELCCKVSRLREDCEYEFRARAIGKGGEGLPGPVQAFRTLPAPKPIPRGLRVSEVCSGSCVAVWQPHKPQHSHSSSSEGEMHCVVQVSSNRQQDYRKVYRGSEAKCVVTELVPHTEYWLRAAFVPAGDIPDPEDGPFCAPISFITTAPEPAPVVAPALDVADSSKELASSSLQFPLSLPKVSAWQLLRRWRRVSIKDLTDHQKVFLFVLAFFVGSVVLAVAISRFM